MDLRKLVKNRRKLYWEPIHAILTDVEGFINKKQARELSGSVKYSLDPRLKEHLLEQLLPKMKDIAKAAKVCNVLTHTIQRRAV
ncbi:hypothetical protein BSKO_02661 [Bryopsis sp. KO-2023]|nr:hypothetical protein BSKO_02661 [Bryopsis sp. KO-2023]